MNAAVGTIIHEDWDASYAADFGRDREPTQQKQRSRHPEYRRKGSAPTRVNGMHCRRQKRWTWGSGRGARMANLRAFAGCLAFAVAALAGSARAVTLDLVRINNTGNAANPTTGAGSVPYSYLMSRTETTNAQYAEFLNSVDAAGTNPRGIFNGLMASNAQGGIIFTGSAAAGSKYTVKPGAPAGTPAGTSYGSMPVTFVSWFSAARYVNWLQNGQLANAATMETGSYILNSATSGSIVARTGSAGYVLPSQNEWYKAAFYTGSGSTYTLYPTNSNTQPANTLTLTGSNAGNWGNSATPTTAATNVGAYVNTTSAYGLYDMWGNAIEMTDSAGSAGQYIALGANFNTFLANVTTWDSTKTGWGITTTALDGGFGFRVAAVPEPETITLAAFGMVGLCGANWLRRRRPGRSPIRSGGSGTI